MIRLVMENNFEMIQDFFYPPLPTNVEEQQDKIETTILFNIVQYLLTTKFQ